VQNITTIIRNDSIKWSFLLFFFVFFFLVVSSPTNLLAYSDPSSIQSVNSLNITSFVPFYSMFFATGLLVVLAFDTLLVNVLVLCILSTVMLGFWPIHSPLGMYESVTKLVNVQVVNIYGHIVPSIGNYFDWPSLFLTSVTFYKLTGISMIHQFQTLFDIIYSWIIAVLAYVVARRLLGHGFASFLAAIIAIEGNISLTTYFFHPDLLGVTLVITMVVTSYLKQNWKSLLLSIPVGLSLISEDFTGALIIAVYLILIGLYPANSWKRYRPYIIGYWLLLAVWSAYWTVTASHDILSAVVFFVRNPFGGFFHVENLYHANIVEPVWANAAKFSWLGVDIFIPVFLALLYAFRGRKAMTIPTFLLFSSMIVLGLSVMINGTNFFALLLYGPFAGSILLVNTLKGRRITLVVLVAFIIVASVPSFLSFNIKVEGSHISADEFYSSYFLVSYDYGYEIFNPSSYISFLNPNAPTAGTPQLFTGTPGSDIPANQVSTVLLEYYNSYIPAGGLLQFAPQTLDIVFHLYGYAIGSELLQNILYQGRSENLVYMNNQYSIYSSTSS
jgi:hypothetical protein